MTLLIAALLLQQPDVLSLVDDLGHEEIEVRDRAGRQLMSIGLPALRAAEAALGSASPDVRSRAGAIVDHIRFRVKGQILFARSLPTTTTILVADPDAPDPRTLAEGPRIYGRRPCMELLPGRPEFLISRFTDYKDSLCVSYPRFDLIKFGTREDSAPMRLVEGFAESFAASPDGKWLAWASSWGHFQVARIGGIALEAKDIAYPQYHAGPTWSPDGKRLLFAGRIQNVEGLREFDPQTGGVRVVAERHVSGIRFSPDGATLLLESHNHEWTAHDSATMKPKTLKFISELPPEYSPDGKTLAVTPEWNRIHLIDVEGKATAKVEGGSPSWSPDGLRLVFARSRTGAEEESCLFILEVPTGREAHFVSGWAPVWTK